MQGVKPSTGVPSPSEVSAALEILSRAVVPLIVKVVVESAVETLIREEVER
jgi:hypothetical protein